jgi:hypothetical protein
MKHPWGPHHHPLPADHSTTISFERMEYRRKKRR